MFTLESEKNAFFRVKRGQSAREIENVLRVPVREAFGGAIIAADGEYDLYTAQPSDSYRTVAARFGVDEDRLKKVNGGGVVYPSRRLFVPRTGG